MNRALGFTIVELLIAIISILAATTAVAYNGVQKRANDTVRRSSASQLVKAYKLYMPDTGLSPIDLECAHEDTGLGFIQHKAGAGPYRGESCVELLADMGFLQQNFNDTIPLVKTFLPDSHRDRTYMMEICNYGRAATLLWHLESPTQEERTNFTNMVQRCRGPAGSFYATNYNMNSGELIEW